MKKIVLIIMFLAMLLAPMMEVFGENQNENQKAKKVYVKPEFVLLMTNEPGGKAINEFDCSDKIYIELNFPKIQEKRHKIEAFWFGPGPFGSREYTEYEFEGSYAYLWLKLPKERLLGGGMEDFMGEWKVKIHLDGKFLERKVFYVAC